MIDIESMRAEGLPESLIQWYANLPPVCPPDDGRQTQNPAKSAPILREADQKSERADFPLALVDRQSVESDQITSESDHRTTAGRLSGVEGRLMTETVKPWTVKSLPPEERNAAIAAAKRDGVTIGDWLARAIRHYVQHGNKPPAATGPEVPEITPEQARAEVRELVSLISELSQAGAAPPKSVAAQAYGLIRQRLKNVKEVSTKALPQPETGETP